MIILGLHYLGNRVAKILPLGKTQIYLVFLSLNRTFAMNMSNRSTNAILGLAALILAILCLLSIVSN